MTRSFCSNYVFSLWPIFARISAQYHGNLPAIHWLGECVVWPGAESLEMCAYRGLGPGDQQAYISLHFCYCRTTIDSTN